LIDDYVTDPPARLKDEAKGGETILQVSHATEASNEDAVCAQVRSHLVGAGTGHPLEERDGKLGG